MTFCKCKSLRRVAFSEGLKSVGIGAFAQTGVEKIVLPPSTKTVCTAAFAECQRLRSVRLNEGLEMLGVGKYNGNDQDKWKTFAQDTLENLTIPPALEEIAPDAFQYCKRVRRVEFLEGRETLGAGEEGSGIWNALFRNCGVEEVALPSTLREVSPDIFNGCSALKVVWVAKGCSLDVRQFVNDGVEVRWLE